MPTYEYRCPEGHDFEQFVLKISDAKGELPCPTCGLVAPRRVSAGAGLLFKGSGFYITDYGKDGKKDQREAAKPASAKGGEPASPAATGRSEASTGGTAPGGTGAPGAPSSGPTPSAAKPAASKPGTSSSPSTPPKSGPAK